MKAFCKNCGFDSLNTGLRCNRCGWNNLPPPPTYRGSYGLDHRDLPGGIFDDRDSAS